MVGMFIVHVRPGQGVAVPRVQSSPSVHDPVNAVSDFVMDVRTAVAQAAVAYEVSMDAAVDSARAGQGRVLDHLPADIRPLVEIARRVVLCKRRYYPKHIYCQMGG